MAADIGDITAVSCDAGVQLERSTVRRKGFIKDDSCQVVSYDARPGYAAQIRIITTSISISNCLGRAMMANRVIAGRFELLEQVGAGGMGTVWRARDQRLHRDVALKEITLSPTLRERLGDQYQRTLREAQAAVRLGAHRGVAQVYDVSDEDASPPWIAMEFITGRSLDKVIDAEGSLPPLRVAEMGRQILETLRASHAAGVLHRDLKPGNVMVTSDGRVILTDFGIAKILGEPTLTEPGPPVGTPGYMAPERVQGLPGTEASDLYALGATLAAALNPPARLTPQAGTAAWDRSHAGAEPTTILVTKPIVSGRTTTPGVPDRLARLIENLRSDSPKDRPQASEAVQLLDSVIAELRHQANGHAQVGAPGAPGPTHGRHARTGRRLNWHRRHTIALVSATCALVVGFSAALTNGFGLAGDTASGGTVPLSTFRVAAVTDNDPDVFAVEGNGTLQHQYYQGGKWQGWITLPPPAGNERITGTPVLAPDSTGRMEAFAVTTGGTLLRWWQDSPGRGPWRGPKPVGPTPVNSDPSVITLPDGELEAFVRLPNGSLGASQQASPGPAAAWSSWQPLGGSLGSAPVAVLNASGAPKVFAITPQGRLAFTAMAGSTWSRWSMLPAQSGETFSDAPAVATTSDGGIEVFARTTAGTLEHWWHPQPGSPTWAGPAQLGSRLRSDPVPTPDPSGRLEMFAVLADGTVAVTRQATADDPAAWSAWTPTGFAADSFLAVLVANSQTYVFAREANGTIAGIVGTPATNWSPIQLGGSF